MKNKWREQGHPLNCVMPRMNGDIYLEALRRIVLNEVISGFMEKL